MTITTDMSRAGATEAKQENSVYILSDESKETVDLLAHRIVSNNGHEPAETSARDVVWELSNKYYQATVAFQSASIDDGKAKAMGSPAVIVLARDHSSLKASLLDELDWPGLEIKLAVVWAEGPLSPRETEDMEDLCLNSDFEFIDAQSLPGTALGDADASSEEEDVVGIPRIREALQTYMWPSMERHAPAGPKPAETGQVSSPQPHDSQTAFEDDFTPFVQASNSEDLPDLATDPSARELDDFDSLTAMLSQLSAARSHSMSLSDDEARREYASDATERFLSGLKSLS